MHRDNAPVGVRQKRSVVIIENSVAPTSMVDAGSRAAGVWLMQVTDNVGIQRSTGVGMVCQEEEDRKDEKDDPAPVDRNYKTVADERFVAASKKVGGDVLVKIEEIFKKLQTENMSLHNALAAEKTAHARALTDNIRLKWDMKKAG